MDQDLHSRAHKRVRSYAALLVLAFVGLASQVQAAGKATTALLPDSILPVIRYAHLVRPIAPTEKLSFTVGLEPRDRAGLEAFCDQVSNPTSPIYRQFITPEEVADQFGPTLADRANVVNYLASKGITVSEVSKNGMAIMASGTVAQIQNAFQTTMATYTGPDPYSGKNFTFRSNATPLSMPTSIAGKVIGVSALENYYHPHHRITNLTPPLARGLYSGATTYSGGFTGAGMRVGISNYDGENSALNAPKYITQYSLPVPGGGAGSNIHRVTVGSGTGTNGQGEGDLDYQMVLAGAPLADIYIYDNAPGDYVAVLARESSDNLCDTISESYGWGPNVTTFNNAHVQHLSLTAQGITYMCASGDFGTNDYKTSGINDPYPNIDSETLNIGGTAPTCNTSTGARITEPTNSGSGGGWYPVSYGAPNWNALPTWQIGTTVPTTVNFHLIPDFAVGMSSWALYYQGNLTAFGGTSCSSPFCAGEIATMEQRLSPAGLPLIGGRPRLGRIQDLVYKMNGRSDVFFDVTTGPSNGTLNSSVFGSTTSSPRVGWEFITGWGCPVFEGFYHSFFIKGAVAFGEWNGSLAQPVTIEVRNASDTTLQTVSTTLDSTGHFAFIPNISVPDGTYTITCKGSHWLRQGLTGIVINHGLLPTALAFSLINGDADADNVVGPLDLNLLRTNFGGSLPAADLDGDGVVGPLDLNIVRNHFGVSGY